jgi:hypothetical protein
MSAIEVVRSTKAMLEEKNIEYCFDGAGNIIISDRNSAGFIVIDVRNPQKCGDVLCEILSIEHEEELCYNLDDVFNVLKRLET